MKHGDKLFAFKLATEKDRANARTHDAENQWRVRDGIAIAGCTDPKSNGVLREAFPWGDGRAYC